MDGEEWVRQGCSSGTACISEPTRKESTRLSHCLLVPVPVPAYIQIYGAEEGWQLGGMDSRPKERERNEGGAASEKQRSPPPHPHLHPLARRDKKQKRKQRSPPHLYSFARGDKKQKENKMPRLAGGSHVHHASELNPPTHSPHKTRHRVDQPAL